MGLVKDYEFMFHMFHLLVNGMKRGRIEVSKEEYEKYSVLRKNAKKLLNTIDNYCLNRFHSFAVKDNELSDSDKEFLRESIESLRSHIVDISNMIPERNEQLTETVRVFGLCKYFGIAEEIEDTKHIEIVLEEDDESEEPDKFNETSSENTVYVCYLDGKIDRKVYSKEAAEAFVAMNGDDAFFEEGVADEEESEEL